MKTFLKTFLNDESGASAAEYALILAVVGVGVGAGALVLGDNITLAIKGAAEEVGKCGSEANDATLPTAFDESVDGTECN